MPEKDQVIGIVAQQWAWTFVHPGADGQLDTEDDIALIDELHVQKDATYVFRLESKDVLHSFSVPVWRLKQDAVPGRVILGWFKPTLAGEFDVQCTEICGIGHGIMGARVIVETAEQHAAWILEASKDRQIGLLAPQKSLRGPT
jgi:cytochrome c oxidase subunit 2